MSRTAGVVLAGGRSTRFEDGTALATVDGTLAVRRVADRLATVADAVVVNCRRDQRPAVERVLDDADDDLRFAVDPVPDRGPAYSLRTGLRVAAAEYAVVCACALPFVDPTLLSYLHNRARVERIDAVFPRVDGRVQPHCGVYHVDRGRDACQSVVDRGGASLQTVADALDPVVVPEPTVREYAHEDAFLDLERAADRSDAAGDPV
jgi:molybdopterin-guanine dinucleotide biosynthesis protein A